MSTPDILSSTACRSTESAHTVWRYQRWLDSTTWLESCERYLVSCESAQWQTHSITVADGGDWFVLSLISITSQVGLKFQEIHPPYLVVGDKRLGRQPDA
jgi:hypothetical protein